MAVKRKSYQTENKGYGYETPPLEKYVIIYFSQKGFPQQAAREFFLYNEKLAWKSKAGIMFRNWKTLVNEWIWENYERFGKLKT